MGGPGQGQNQTQPPSTASQSRKGTFTDDLHKLVDNWARDAMNLSQGKRCSKPQQQVPSQGHSYEVTPPGQCMPKYSSAVRCESLCAPSVSGHGDFDLLESELQVKRWCISRQIQPIERMKKMVTPPFTVPPPPRLLRFVVVTVRSKQRVSSGMLSGNHHRYQVGK